ncbi:MAG: metallophosphoesterase [Deltaproteobacteria bacterium]|nr:metallophosphoesterase [Deltaproteobacteria bacterium]
MRLSRRRFLQLCGVSALFGPSLSLSGCSDSTDEGVVPTSAEGSAMAPPRPAQFIRLNDLGSAPNAEGAIGTAGQLISFGQISDTHITLDDFSVTGNLALESLLDSFGDNIGFGGLDRPQPQERYDVDVLQAIVKTMNAVVPPLDLIVHTGDAIDAGVMTELVSFLGEINQSGLPWLQAIGNHDRLALGNIRPSLAENLSSLDFVDTGQFIREHFFRHHVPTELMFGSMAMGFDFGPGFNGDPNSVKGFYAFSPVAPVRDVSNVLVQPGVRFYVLESTLDAGSAEGGVSDEQISWLAGQLDQHTDSLAIVISHHRLNDLTIGRDDLVGVLFDHPQVIAVLSGHDHTHRIRAFPVSGEPHRGFWQIQTSSLIDFPQQARILEVINNADGTGIIRTFVFNQQATGQLGENARASYESSIDDPFNGEGAAEDRDVELLFQFPQMT